MVWLAVTFTYLLDLSRLHVSVFSVWRMWLHSVRLLLEYIIHWGRNLCVCLNRSPSHLSELSNSFSTQNEVKYDSCFFGSFCHLCGPGISAFWKMGQWNIRQFDFVFKHDIYHPQCNANSAICSYVRAPRIDFLYRSTLKIQWNRLYARWIAILCVLKIQTNSRTWSRTRRILDWSSW